MRISDHAHVRLWLKADFSLTTQSGPALLTREGVLRHSARGKVQRWQHRGFWAFCLLLWARLAARGRAKILFGFPLFADFFEGKVFTESHWLVSLNSQSTIFINPHPALKLAE